MQQLGEQPGPRSAGRGRDQPRHGLGNGRGRVDDRRAGTGDPAPVRGRRARSRRTPPGRRGRGPVPRPRSAASGGGIALPFAMAMAEYDLGPTTSRSRSPPGTSTSGSRRSCSPSGPAGGRARGRDGARPGSDGPRGREPHGAARAAGLLGDPPGRGSGRSSPHPRSWTRSTRRAAIDAGAEVVRVDVPPESRARAAHGPHRHAAARAGGRILVARRPRAADPAGADPGRRPARARRPAPVRRRGWRAPSRLRAADDRGPRAGCARPGGRRGLRADRHRGRRPDGRDRRRPRGSRSCAGRPRVRPSRAPRAGTGVLVPAGPLRVAQDIARACRPTRRPARGARWRSSSSRSRWPGGTGCRRKSRWGRCRTGWWTSPTRPLVRPARSPCGGRSCRTTRWRSSSRRCERRRRDLARDRRCAAAGRRRGAAVVRRPGATAWGQTRGAVRVAASLRATRAPHLRGIALEHANRAAAAAAATLAALEDSGWGALVDRPLGIAAGPRRGRGGGAHRGVRSARRRGPVPRWAPRAGRGPGLRGGSGRRARPPRPAARTSGSASAPRGACRKPRAAAARRAAAAHAPVGEQLQGPASSRPSAVSAYSIRAAAASTASRRGSRRARAGGGGRTGCWARCHRSPRLAR